MIGKVRVTVIPADEGSRANRILRAPEVEARTGLGRSSRNRKIKAGEFPVPVSLGARAVGWLESEIEAWIESRPAARSEKAPAGDAA